MSYTCTDEANAVTRALGFSCEGANPVGALRSPLGLEHWTMPLLELLIVAGAVFALVHAWRRWRRDGDGVNLALWFGSLVYLAVIEPPLYFPEWFGLQQHVGFIFAHNVFTVQFMFDRLPLYIVAFYPVISQIAYELVRALGIFERRGVFLGAVATAFASQVFYEIFDHLGPQLLWWGWNPENTINRPMFDSVPMNSMWVFATVSFGVLVWLCVKLTGGRRLSGGALAWRTVVAGVLTPILMVIFAAPTRVDVGVDGDVTVQQTLIWVLIGLVWAVGLWLLAEATLRTWRGGSPEASRGITSPGFVRVYPALYLGVHAVFWLTALPAFLAATDGRTEAGTPTGNGPYALACGVMCLWFVVAATRASRGSRGARPTGGAGARRADAGTPTGEADAPASSRS